MKIFFALSLSASSLPYTRAFIHSFHGNSHNIFSLSSISDEVKIAGRAEIGNTNSNLSFLSISHMMDIEAEAELKVQARVEYEAELKAAKLAEVSVEEPMERSVEKQLSQSSLNSLENPTEYRFNPSLDQPIMHESPSVLTIKPQEMSDREIETEFKVENESGMDVDFTEGSESNENFQEDIKFDVVEETMKVLSSSSKDMLDLDWVGDSIHTLAFGDLSPKSKRGVPATKHQNYKPQFSWNPDNVLRA